MEKYSTNQILYTETLEKKKHFVFNKFYLNTIEISKYIVNSISKREREREREHLPSN